MKGYPFHIKKSTPMSSNYSEKKFCSPQSGRSHRNQRPIVMRPWGQSQVACERQGVNFDDELYVAEQSDLDFAYDLNRTPKRPKSGLKRTLVEEREDEAAERKAKGVKHGSKVYPLWTFLALVGQLWIPCQVVAFLKQCRHKRWLPILVKGLISLCNASTAIS